MWDFRCRHLNRWLLIEKKTSDICSYRIDAMMIEIFLSILCSMFTLKNKIFITQNDVWQTPVVTLFSRLCLCAFCSYGRLVREDKKNAYISLQRRERKIRDWSSTMIGQEPIVLCNFWTNNRERERNRKTSIARDFLFSFSKHLLAFREYKSEKKKKSIYHLSCLPLS